MDISTGLYINLINYCNTQINNANDYQIAKVILESIGKVENLSLEQMSEKANISQASISRFIKKAGFASYQQFREAIPKGTLDVSLNRQLFNVTHYQQKSDELLANEVFDDVIQNLMATKENLTIEKLKEILHLMKGADNVTFYGDDHALSLFFTLQLDLISNKVPTYLFKKEEIQEIHTLQLSNKSVVVFFQMKEQWVTPVQRKTLSLLKEKGTKLVLFSQDPDHELENMFDIVYPFGKEKMYNYGYYSLFYLSMLISELYYRI